MNVELIEHTPNPEETIERAARVCYDSKTTTKERRDKFLMGLVKSGHTATIEHASATFMISGVSRALTHELVRHRLMSFCQRSQRYCNEDGFSYVIPDTIVQHPQYVVSEENGNEESGIVMNIGLRYVSFMKQVEEFYNEMVKLGIPKEDARYVLPNACCTQICVSANFREWRHFIELRCDKAAQWEIRALADVILDKLHTIAPAIFQDLYEKYLGKDEPVEQVVVNS